MFCTRIEVYLIGPCRNDPVPVLVIYLIRNFCRSFLTAWNSPRVSDEAPPFFAVPICSWANFIPDPDLSEDSHKFSPNRRQKVPKNPFVLILFHAHRYTFKSFTITAKLLLTSFFLVWSHLLQCLSLFI